MILDTWWMVLDTKPAPLGRLYVYGILELENGRDHELKATHILISGLNGMIIVGWPDKPMLNNVIISLMGTTSYFSKRNHPKPNKK